MALTILEASKLNSGEVKRSAIIEMFAENSDILRVLPFDNIPGDSFSYNVEGTLPAVAFRGYNEDYSQVAGRGEGVLNPQTERLRIAGGELDVDRQIVKTRGLEQRSVQEAMKVKALALRITATIINGDSDTNVREFDGLKKRIVGNQILPALSSAPSANSPLSLQALDTAIDQVEAPTHLIMSKAMRTRLSGAARDTSIGGYIRWDLDEFGEQVMFYGSLPILIADIDDAGARIIDFNEAGPGGASVSTSIYVTSMGDGKMLGLQNGTMEVMDLGELDEKPVFRTRIEWLMGMAIMHGRSVARVWGITNAAVTA